MQFSRGCWCALLIVAVIALSKVAGGSISGIGGSSIGGLGAAEPHRALAADSQQWFLVASQDAHPVIGLMHCATASAKLSCLESQLSTANIKRTCDGLDPLALRRQIRELQTSLMSRLSEKYPSLTVDFNAKSQDWFLS